MRRRVFIVAPSPLFPEDVAHHVCTTTQKGSIDDIYNADAYVIRRTETSLVNARKYTKKYLKAKRPKVI